LFSSMKSAASCMGARIWFLHTLHWELSSY
jgi:hypothetical protein